jgi:hypothetical protein
VKQCGFNENELGLQILNHQSNQYDLKGYTFDNCSVSFSTTYAMLTVPNAINLALKIPFILIFNADLLFRNLLPSGIFYFEITSHYPLLYMSIDSFPIASTRFTLESISE